MARFKGADKANSGGSAVATLTIPNPTHVSGDLLVCVVIVDNGSETISIDGAVSGWSVATQQTSVNPSLAVFYNRASGSSEDDLIADSTGSGEMNGITLNLGDTHATSVIHAVSAVASGSDDDITSQTVTTTEANAYILEIIATRPGSGRQFTFMPGVQQLANSNDEDHTSIAVAGFTQQSAGTTTAHRAINGGPSGNYVAITLAIRDDGNGNIEGQVDPDTAPVTPIHVLAATSSGAYSGDL